MFPFLLLLLICNFASARVEVQQILLDNQERLSDKQQAVIGVLDSSAKFSKAFEEQQTIAAKQKRYVTQKSVGEVDCGQTVLDKMTMDELELVSGQVGSKDQALAEFTDRTKTDCGKYLFRSYLLQPITSADVLTKRNVALKKLAADPALLVRLQAILARVAAVENLLAANVLEDPIANSYEQTLPNLPWYVPFGSQFNSLSRSSTVIANFNRCCWTLGSYLEANPFSYLPVAVAASCISTVPVYLMYKYNPGFATAQTGYFDFLKTLAFSPDFANMRSDVAQFGIRMSVMTSSYKYPYLAYEFYKDPNMPELMKTLSLVGGLSWAGWRGYTTYKNASLDASRMHFMQEKMMAVARLVESLDEIEALLNENPALAETIDSEGLLKKVLHSSLKDYTALLENLRSNTFKGNPSYWSNQGRITTTYAAFKKHQEALYKGFSIIGEVDVLQAAGQLLRESTPEHPWSLPTYEFGMNSPQLEVEGAWHPYLTSIKPVLNTVKLGGGSSPRAIIVTGPNAGGKSTVMKAVSLSALMAQTKIGVVPAKSIKITPFDAIITYLNITDRLAEGDSLFKASVKRAHDVIEGARAQQDADKKVLVMLDEVFTGTSSKEGSAAAYALVKTLGHMSHTITVAVTHFPVVTKLEQEFPALFSNWKVGVIKNGNGTLTYPFVLEKGVSDQNIAFDIMKNEGYSHSFISEAQNALAALS